MITIQDLRKLYYEENDVRLKLLSEVNDYTVYCHFIGREVKCGEFICSPLRPDGTPSFNIYFSRDPKWENQILFKDFSGPSGNVFQFVEYWARFNEGLQLNSNYEIVDYIRGKMQIASDGIARKLEIPERSEVKNYLISAYPKYTPKCREYLEDLGIDLDMSHNVYNVFSCEYLMNEYQQVIHNFRNTVTFAYVIFDKFKLYQPYEENFIKFFNHCPAHYVQGLQQCKVEGQDTLIITKAMKDILVIQSHTERWYDIIAPHGEGYNTTVEWLAWYLRYPRIILMYDPDITGISGMVKLRRALKAHPDYNGQRVDVRFVWDGPRIMKSGKMIVPVKDSADYRLIYGGTRTRERLKVILA